jgi:hypothetical protein
MSLDEKIIAKKFELADFSIILAQISKDKNGKLEEASILVSEIGRLLKEIVRITDELHNLENLKEK